MGKVTSAREASGSAHLKRLDAAIEFGHKDIVTLLRNHGGKTAKEF